MAVEDPELVVVRFNDCINQQDLAGLIALMTEDHLFVDSAGQRTKGREAMRVAWSSFFAAFPSYTNTFVALESLGERVLVLGCSTCSEPLLNGPAIWVAVVKDGLVAEWQVHDDTPENRRLMQLSEGT
jgi:ketosteroid isomerase-like protein